VYLMKKSLKYWLWGSICIIIINFIVFLFRNKVDQIVLLWIVILTPVVFVALYPLTCLLDRNSLLDGDRTARKKKFFNILKLNI
jgi:Mn2+/Fe2+ NRAMP family transporter